MENTKQTIYCHFTDDPNDWVSTGELLGQTDCKDFERIAKLMGRTFPFGKNKYELSENGEMVRILWDEGDGNFTLLSIVPLSETWHKEEFYRRLYAVAGGMALLPSDNKADYFWCIAKHLPKRLLEEHMRRRGLAYKKLESGWVMVGVDPVFPDYKMQAQKKNPAL